MELFWKISLSFPTVIPGFLLCLACVYWLLTVVGLFDADIVDVEVAAPLEGMSGVLFRLGLVGLPLTLVLTILFFFTWLFSYFSCLLLFNLVDTGILRFLLGTVLLIGSIAVSIPVTGKVTKPIRPLFRSLTAPQCTSLLGQTVVVRSEKVTPRHGEALFADGGAGLILKVRAAESDGFKRGDRVILLSYSEVENTYNVISEQEFYRA
jgi:hypothetical protein